MEQPIGEGAGAGEDHPMIRLLLIAALLSASLGLLLGCGGESDAAKGEEEDDGIVAGVAERAKSTVDKAKEVQGMERELIEE
jgi:hypothetical protein